MIKNIPINTIYIFWVKTVCFRDVLSFKKKVWASFFWTKLKNKMLDKIKYEDNFKQDVNIHLVIQLISNRFIQQLLWADSQSLVLV